MKRRRFYKYKKAKKSNSCLITMSASLTSSNYQLYSSNFDKSQFSEIQVNGKKVDIENNKLTLVAGVDTLVEYFFKYLTNADYLFSLGTIVSVDCTNLDISQVFSMKNMFAKSSISECPFDSLPEKVNPLMCYEMFEGCNKLIKAPRLPATSLSYRCYERMFSNCTSLKIAPDLPAIALVEHCYYDMFNGCAKLNYIKMLATDISAKYCLYHWVNGVSSTGTFVKHPDMTSLPTGVNGIPEGWTVVNDGEGNLINFTISSFLEDYPEKTYQAEAGMTWEDFCNSKYNVDNWYLRDIGVKTLVIHQYGNEETVCLNGEGVDALDIIVPSGSYKYYL